MSKIFDFSKALIRCHAIYFLVADGKEKTPKQKYEYFQTVLAEEMQKYEDMGERKQGMANGLKKAAKIAGLEHEIRLLEPRKHEDPLSTQAKSYLKRLYGELKYGKWSASKEKGNKYTDKGKMVEPEALALMSRLDGEMYSKNEIRLENEFLSGIPDCYRGESIYKADYIPDAKSSWDFETFIENLGKPLNPLYWWQNQGYFDLTGATIGEVSYCLINTPESIINDELYKLMRRMDVVTEEDPDYKEAAEKLINNMTFDNMSDQEKRLKFEVKRDDNAIKKIHDKVPLCREYLSEIQEMHLTGFFSDKELPILDTIEEI